MEKIGTDTVISKVELFSDFSGYLLYKARAGGRPASEQSLAELQRQTPGWNAENMARGLRRLRDCQVKGNTCFDVYEDIGDDPQKKDVKLWYLPAEPSEKECQKDGDCEARRPFLILLSGGGYSCVCSAVESLPAADTLNGLGYDVFVLNYRAGGEGLMPKPLEDLAAAYRYIIANKQWFGTGDRYIVCGFSAGGNLAALWGTESAGYRHYNVRKPEALILAYPLTSFDHMYEAGKEEILTTMLGKDYICAKADTYDVGKNVTAGFPPCYILHCEDDPSVPAAGSKYFKALLDQENVISELDIRAAGGHAFGDGGGTGMDGWICRALEFTEALENKI